MQQPPHTLMMVHASMELRTRTYSEMGALSGLMHDDESDATSWSTTRCVEKAIQSVQSYIKNGKYCGLHIDEPEIGYGEELQAGCGAWLRKKLDAMEDKPCVTLVTTHSKHVARAFHDWKFIDLGFKYHNVQDWCRRRIKPADPEEILEIGHLFFSVVQTRINANKKK